MLYWKFFGFGGLTLFLWYILTYFTYWLSNLICESDNNKRFIVFSIIYIVLGVVGIIGGIIYKSIEYPEVCCLLFGLNLLISFKRR